jgi:GNAT superfamily N-acetyltransferase
MDLADFFHFNGITLERISETDVFATVNMINKAYDYDAKHHYKPRTNQQHLRNKMSSTNLYVARQSAELVGCVYIEQKGTSIHFGLLTLVKRLQGQGIGIAIVSAIEQYAKSAGAKYLEIDYVSAAPWLRPYYERQGFNETGQHEKSNDIELIRMMKPI